MSFRKLRAKYHTSAQFTVKKLICGMRRKGSMEILVNNEMQNNSKIRVEIQRKSEKERMKFNRRKREIHDFH